MVPGEAQLQIVKGFNLEIALFLAGLTGSFVYTDTLVHWRCLHEHTRAGSTAHSDASWSPVIENIKAITFPMQYDEKQLMTDRISGGQSGSIRRSITRLLCSMLDVDIPVRLSPLVTELDSSVHRMNSKWQEQSPESVLDVQFEFSVPADGFENNAVRRLIVTFGRANDIRIVPIAMLLHIYRAATE
jgi:hypothetical protein